MSMSKVRRLPIADTDAAIRLYYGKGYLNNNDIGKIFGTEVKSTIFQMKKPVMAEEKNRNLPIVVPYHVNAKIAFEVWGLDIEELELNRKKLKELGLNKDM